MNTFGKVVLGALAGAVTLGAIAGLYCTFCKDDEDNAESFSELESNDDIEQLEGVEDNLETA